MRVHYASYPFAVKIIISGDSIIVAFEISCKAKSTGVPANHSINKVICIFEIVEGS